MVAETSVSSPIRKPNHLILTAWLATLLASALPEVLLHGLRISVPAWLSRLKLATLGALIVLAVRSRWQASFLMDECRPFWAGPLPGRDPGGLPGFMLTGFLGYLMGKAMLETRGFGRPWLTHFITDILVLMFTVTM